MYFMVNTAFVNYLDEIGNPTETLKTPILTDKTISQQILPISLNVSNFDMELLTLKDFIHQYKCKKEIFDLEERHASTDMDLPTKNFFSSNFILDVFSVCCCNNFSIGYAFDSIFVMQTYETQNISNQSCFAVNKRSRCRTIWEDVFINTCKIQFYTILALSFSILGLVLYAVLHSRKFKIAEDISSLMQ